MTAPRPVSAAARPGSAAVARVARRGRSERGAALIEFSLVLPLLLVLSLGVIEIGHLIQTRLVLTNICREGGSIGSRQLVLDDGLTALLASSAAPLRLAGPDGRIVATRIRAGANAAEPLPVVVTQVEDGTLGVASRIGDDFTNLGLTPRLYDRLVFDVDQGAPDISEVTVIEVFYKHRTLTPLPAFLEGFLLPDAGGFILSSKSVF